MSSRVRFLSAFVADHASPDVVGEAALVEDPAVVRELVGALAYRGWRRGALVTTSARFSSMAIETETAPALQKDGYSVDLYTIDALRDLVRSTVPPAKPWLDLVWEGELSAEDRAEQERQGLTSINAGAAPTVPP